ncbi:hypothetical protein B5807_02657 [Epicoccum nigrum]|jgi:hypothetical protein|uniref:Uncharacterized protein n=1 Tax=Epicoccum nigrum TaxID=105696 RepID=A0A1Y2MBF2_EPING|nr:hypothetical protein B5807_02657 [Epicoccum nigrum]
MSTPRLTNTVPTTDHAQLKHDLDLLITRIDKHEREKIESLIPVIYRTHDESEKLWLRLWLGKNKQILANCRNMWVEGVHGYFKNTADGHKEAKVFVKRANEELLEIGGVRE